MNDVADFEILVDRVIEVGKNSSKKKLVPAKWDLPYLQAKEMIKVGSRNRIPELMESREFNMWINQTSLHKLEKQHHLERSPSLDKFKVDVGGGASSPKRAACPIQREKSKIKILDELSME